MTILAQTPLLHAYICVEHANARGFFLPYIISDVVNEAVQFRDKSVEFFGIKQKRNINI